MNLYEIQVWVRKDDGNIVNVAREAGATPQQSSSWDVNGGNWHSSNINDGSYTAIEVGTRLNLEDNG